MFDVILLIVIGVLLLATVIFLGFGDDETTEFFDTPYPHSGHTGTANRSKGFPAPPGVGESSSLNVTQPPLQQQNDAASTVSDTYTFTTYTRNDRASRSNNLSLPTTMPTDQDQRSLWRKIVDVVKQMTKSSWNDYGKYPGDLRTRRRDANRLRRENKKKDRTPVYLFQRQHQQQQHHPVQ